MQHIYSILNRLTLTVCCAVLSFNLFAADEGDIFFSKYFESKGSVKGIAIYNGSNEFKYLKNLRIRVDPAAGTQNVNGIKFSNQAEVPDYLAPHKELQLYSYNSGDQYIVDSIQKSTDMSNWAKISGFAPSGKNAVFLERQNGDDWELIDIIGAAQFDEGEKLYMRDATYVVNYNSVENDDRSDEYRYKIWLDGEGWYAADGLSYDEVDNEGLPLVVGINTNRCFLIRNSDVINGKNAVAQNTVIQEGNLGADFVTLATEWKGKHIPRYDNDEKDTQGTSAGFATLSNAGYYLINFYSCDGGDLLDNQNIAISDDNRIPIYGGETPEREGGEGEVWIFAGWVLDKSCGVEAVEPENIYTSLPEANDDINYYAYFTNDCDNRQQVTIVIKDNEGNDLPVDANVVAEKNGIVSCDDGTVALTASDEYSQNYKFLKWTWVDSQGQSQSSLNKNQELDLSGYGAEGEVTINAVFVEAANGDTLTYRYETDDAGNKVAYLIKGENLYSGDIKIPEQTVRRDDGSGDKYIVVGIDAKVFTGNDKINSVTIPATVETIDHTAFQGADDYGKTETTLTEIIVEAGNNNFSSEDGVLFSKDKTTLLAYPANKAGTSYEIPGTVTNLGAHAFSDNQNLASIDISHLNEMTILPEACFARSNLISVILPSSIEVIEHDAMRDMSQLEALDLPEGLGEIELQGIGYTHKLTEITLPSTLKSLGKNALCSSSKGGASLIQQIYVKSLTPATLHSDGVFRITGDYPIIHVPCVSVPQDDGSEKALIDIYKEKWSTIDPSHFEEAVIFSVTADVNNDDEGNPMGSVEISEPSDCEDTDDSGDLVWECQAIENELTLFDHWEDLNGNTLKDETGNPWGATITFKNLDKDTSIIAIFTDAYPVFYVMQDDETGEVDNCTYVEIKYTINEPITEPAVMALEGLGATECNIFNIVQFGEVTGVDADCITLGDAIDAPETMPAQKLYAEVEFDVYTDTLFAHSKYPSGKVEIDTILNVPCGDALLTILESQVDGKYLYRHTTDCYDFDAGNWYAIGDGVEVDLDRFSVMPKDTMHVWIDGSAVTHQIYFDGVQRAKNYACSDTIQFPSADFDKNYKYLYGWKYTTIQPGDAPTCGDELDVYTVMQLQEDGSMGTITISQNTKACSIVKSKRIYLHKGEDVAYDIVEVDGNSTLPRQLSSLKPSAADGCYTFDTQDWKLCDKDGAGIGGDIPDYIANDTIIHVRIDSALIEFPIIYEVNRQINENTIITQTKESIVTCEIVVCGDDGKCSYNIPDEIINFFKEDQKLAWDDACDNEIEWGGANIAAELEAIISNGTTPIERSRIVGRITPKNHTLLLMVDGEEYDRDPGKQCNADLVYIVDMKPSGDAYDEKYECQDFDGWYVNSDFSGDKLTAPADMGKTDRTFYGRFVDKTYTITITIDNDTVDALAKTDYKCDEEVTLPAALKDGYSCYSLTGWEYKKVVLPGDIDDEEWQSWKSPYEMPHFDIELKPVIKENSYYIHFYENDVENENKKQLAECGESVYTKIMSTEVPVSSDGCKTYDNQKWKYLDGSDVGGNDVMPAKDISVKITPVAKEYNIHFEKDGVEDRTLLKSFASDAEITALPDLGGDYSAWDGEVSEGDAMPCHDVTLSAKSKHTITYTINVYRNEENVGSYQKQEPVYYGDEIETLPSASDFDGFSLSENCYNEGVWKEATGGEVVAPYEVLSDVTLSMDVTQIVHYATFYAVEDKSVVFKNNRVLYGCGETINIINDHPAVPAGKTWDGWNPSSATMGDADVDFIPTFIDNDKAKIHYVVLQDEKEIDSWDSELQTIGLEIDIDAKPSDNTGCASYSQWSDGAGNTYSGSIVMPESLTLYSTKTANKISITFVSNKAGGVTLTKTTLEFVCDETITKPATQIVDCYDENSVVWKYTIGDVTENSDWSALPATMTEDLRTAPAAITARPEASKSKFTIAFVNDDEKATVLQSTDVECGETPTYTGETPTKAADAQYTYEFDGWKDESGNKYSKAESLPSVTGGATYTATYSATENTYQVHFFVDKEEVTGEIAEGVTLPKSVQYGSNLAEVVACYTPEPADEDDCMTFDGKAWMLKNEAAGEGEDEYVAITADDVVESDVNVYIESGLKTLTATFVIEESQIRKQVTFDCGSRPTAPTVDDKSCKTFAWDWGDYADEEVGIEEDDIVINGSYSDVEPALLTVKVLGDVPQSILDYDSHEYSVACGTDLKDEILYKYVNIAGYDDAWSGVPENGFMPAEDLEITITYTKDDNPETPNIPEIIEVAICEGDEEGYCWNTYLFTEEGYYPIDLVDEEGNHNVKILHLVVTPKQERDTTVVACELPYQLGDNKITQEGLTTLELKSAKAGCDSIVNVTLLLYDGENPIERYDTICAADLENGYAHTSYGDLTPDEETELYYEAKDYIAFFTTPEGCTYEELLHLIAMPEYEIDTTLVECVGFTLDDIDYTKRGDYQYRQELQTEFGCDSIINWKLKIIEPGDVVEVSEQVCALPYEREVSVLDELGERVLKTFTYEEAGDYVETVATPSGCEYRELLHLTLAKPTYSVVKRYICSGGSVMINDETYNQTGQYQQTIKNVAGCDSTIFIFINDMSEISVIAKPNMDGWGKAEIISGPECTENGKAEVIVQAIPSDGYHFSQWNGGSQDNPYRLDVDRDTVIVANFYEAKPKVDMYSITTGTTDLNRGWVNAWLDLKAKPNRGYEFAYWTTTDVELEDYMDAEQQILLGDEDFISIEAVFRLANPEVILGGNRSHDVVTDLEDEEILNSIIVQDGRITVTGHEGRLMQVYSVVGQLLYNGKIESDKTEVFVPAHSVYLVKIGDKIAKVVMK